MIQENEVVMLTLGALLFYYTVSNRKQWISLPYSRLILGSYFFFFAAWNFTVIEGFILPEIFNLLEHLSYAAGAVILTTWTFKIIRNRMYL